MTSETDEVDLAAPTRRHTQAVTWAIAAQLTAAHPDLVLDRLPTGADDTDLLLRARLLDEGGTFAVSDEPVLTFRHSTGITVRSAGEVETIDWFDVFAQSFPDVTTDVLGEAIGRHHRESDAPGDLGLVHDFVATILAVTVDDEHEWSVHYTPREWHGTQMPGCHLSRDGLEAAHVTFTGRHRPHGAGTLRLTTRIDTPFCALPRGPYEPPVNLSELFHDCDHDMLATVITALGTRIGA